MLNGSRMFKKLSRMSICWWEGGGNEIHGNGLATTNGFDSTIGAAYLYMNKRLLDSVTYPVNVWPYALIPCGQTEFWLVFRPGSGKTKSRSIQGGPVRGEFLIMKSMSIKLCV